MTVNAKDNLVAFAKQVGADYKELRELLQRLGNVPTNAVTAEQLQAQLTQFENKLKGGELAENLDTLFEIAQKINSIVSDNAVAQSLTETLNSIKNRIETLETNATLDLLTVYTNAKNGVSA